MPIYRAHRRFIGPTSAAFLIGTEEKEWPYRAVPTCFELVLCQINRPLKTRIDSKGSRTHYGKKSRCKPLQLPTVRLYVTSAYNERHPGTTLYHSIYTHPYTNDREILT